MDFFFCLSGSWQPYAEDGCYMANVKPFTAALHIT